jgi:hypothetical protein
MGQGASYLHKRFDLADQQVEGWLKEHRAAQAVWDMEVVYTDLINMVNQVFEIDTHEHLLAAKSGDAARLEQWTNALKEIADSGSKALARFGKAARKMKVDAYKDCKIDMAVLDKYEKRLWSVFRPTDDYLGREDVNAAVRESEADHGASRVETDRLEPS